MGKAGALRMRVYRRQAKGAWIAPTVWDAGDVKRAALAARLADRSTVLFLQLPLGCVARGGWSDGKRG